MLTDRALSSNAITIQEAQLLEDFIDSNLDDLEDDEPMQMPKHIQRIYEIALRYYHHSKAH